MGCFGDQDDEDSECGKPLQFDPKFSGPIKNRSCTDVLCLLVFIAYWVGMIVVAGFAFKEGDPQRLVRSVDTHGRKCGYSTGVKDRPYLLFFDVSRCAASVVTFSPDEFFTCNTPQVCVKSCPTANEIGVDPSNDVKNNVYCTNGKLVGDHSMVELAKAIKDGVCPPYYLSSEKLLSRCVPLLSVLSKIGNDVVTVDNGTDVLKTANNQSLIGNNALNGVRGLANFLNLRSRLEEAWTDFGKIWAYILGGVVLILLFCFIYIFLLRYILGFMIYASCITILCLMIWGVVICYDQYKKFEDEPETKSANTLLDTFKQQKETWLGLGVTLTIITVVLFLIFVFLFKRIALAVAVIKESSKALHSIKSAIFFPIITYFMQFALFVWFVGVGVFLVTASEPKYAYENFNGMESIEHNLVLKNGSMTQYNYTVGVECKPKDEYAQLLESNNLTNVTLCAFKEYKKDKTLFRMQLYHLFGWLWSMNWILALGQCVLAGAFASYYWAFKKPDDIPGLPVMSSLKRTIFYHSGSLAFGALVIAIVQFIRAILAFIQRRAEKSGSTVAKFILRCFACFFWCLEKCLKFINKNAYIEIAVYGYSFCKACRKAFSLILRNIARVVVINGITAFILFLGKLVITAGVALVSYYVFDSLRKSEELNFYLAPIIFLTIVAFVIAHGFLNVFDMAIDTIFLCVLEDLERNDGSPEKPYFMSSDLKKTLKVDNKPADD